MDRLPIEENSLTLEAVAKQFETWRANRQTRASPAWALAEKNFPGRTAAVLECAHGRHEPGGHPGDMSLVGTRPPTLYEVQTYKTEHLKRIAAKPGITGLWQVSGRNKITDFDTVVALDCRYLDNWRFSLDLKILFKTLWVVLQRKGAV